ncbi:MAG: nitronate monooxygenase [Synergistaceae bacterium]|nr:nitronate monooxygenase [Synergistaceae bacterium]
MEETKIHTALSDLLGIEFPIIQGAMAHISNGTFAAAVSEAGGLGIIASAAQDADFVRKEVRAARERTKRPFGVSIVLNNPHCRAIVDVILEEGVAVVTTGAGNPEPYVKDLLSGGCKILSVVPHVHAALKVEALGVTAVVAEGEESGGHIGTVSTMTLVPLVAEALRIPVIAAGGIADGRGFLAALAMGAVGVQMGTAFLATKECPVHPAFKEKVLAAKETDSVVTCANTRNATRCIRNSLTDSYFEGLRRHLDEAELLKPLTGSLLRAVEGDVTNGSIQAGQIAGMLHEIKTVRQVMEDVMAGAERALQKVKALERAC